MKYMITNTIQYTEILLIEADSEQEARDLSIESNGWEPNFDEEVYDSEVDEMSDEDWDDIKS